MKIQTPERTSSPAKAEDRPVGEGAVQPAATVAMDVRGPVAAVEPLASELAQAFPVASGSPAVKDYGNAAPGMTVKNGMTLFFHSKAPLSNWHPAAFQVRGVRFTCVEQFMMWSKATLFGDDKAADAILRTHDPKAQKAVGRAVKGFSEETWLRHRKPILVEGCLAKFGQNPDLKAVLIGTKGTTLVEASPYDRIWGCGLSAEDPKILDQRNWRGENLLGKVLEEVREMLDENLVGPVGAANPDPDSPSLVSGGRGPAGVQEYEQEFDCTVPRRDFETEGDEGLSAPVAGHPNERPVASSEPRKSGIDFKKLGEKMQYEREHGPRLDQEWEEGRKNGTIPIFLHETHDAILTGNTFAVKEQIKHMLGKWDGGRKAWVVPAIGTDYCGRSNFDYVQKLQERLDDLKTKGVVITYVEPNSHN